MGWMQEERIQITPCLLKNRTGTNNELKITEWSKTDIVETDYSFLLCKQTEDSFSQSSLSMCFI